MKSVAALWQMKPVQTGAKALGAGVVACASLWAYRQATSSISGPSDSNYKMLCKEIPDLALRLEPLWTSEDREWIDILGRLEVFRKFAPVEFDDVVRRVLDATEERRGAYKRRLRPTDSFKIRASYQKIIEEVRVLRSIIEYVLVSATEDFDEVAVDLNAKVDQAAQDAIQDTA